MSTHLVPVFAARSCLCCATSVLQCRPSVLLTDEFELEKRLAELETRRPDASFASRDGRGGGGGASGSYGDEMSSLRDGFGAMTMSGKAVSKGASAVE